MDKVPTLREEINRKALVALESLLSDYERGVITPAQYSRANSALWEVFSGLVDDGVMYLFGQMPTVRRDQSFIRSERVGKHIIRLDESKVEIFEAKLVKEVDRESSDKALALFNSLKEKLQ